MIHQQKNHHHNLHEHHRSLPGSTGGGVVTPQVTRRRCEGTAMGAITLDLSPGVGIGPFTIGMPICEAFAQVEQQPNIYDVVHVNCYDEEPLKLDIVISFPDHGFHLRFDPWSQVILFTQLTYHKEFYNFFSSTCKFLFLYNKVFLSVCPLK
ncbi:hypothetical protein ZOSMA_196G00540 [Zostera marina]|uniref:Uncharacterized protein n=1 Tax=Zostera marina TaxID=29655 RepID=A0A0K9PP31_ZOSMR|nr:hypothetical protein ZOSMA_196G00540 [Zostera marina]